MIDAVYIVGAFLLSVYICLKVRWMCEEKGMFNEVSKRSSHNKPTLRGGGLGIALTVLPVSFLIIFFTDVENKEYLLALTFSSIGIVAMGWLDDIKPRSAILRLFVQVICVGVCLYFIPPVFEFLPLWAEKTIFLLAWIWFINLYNFMDGIDGLAAAQAAFLAFALSLVFIDIKFIALVLMGASIGFLRLNWHPAKIFLGDVGSTFLGFFLAGLMFINLNMDTVFPLLTISLLFTADATFTLIKRIVQGKKPWQPHKEHFYQQAVSAGITHSEFVIRALAINVVLLILFILGFSVLGPFSLIFGLIAVAIFFWRMNYLGGK
jgi:UDP-N-acetylmuramyl pentapeptide phosphotransferase/UDP-N-acetylglucosamine-1-phosphate transferase